MQTVDANMQRESNRKNEVEPDAMELMEFLVGTDLFGDGCSQHS
ncbi:MAG: hypothetical protein VB049_10060 [Candidatus Pelethousia sp.]|nr:hypothetical protein [Candidatus Pelethousia sp.]